VGGDFIQFYTLGDAALRGEYPALAAANALHARQVQLLAASDPEFYYPVYPPQAALLFAPLAKLPYLLALALWTAMLIVVYAAIVWRTWRSVRDVLPDRIFVAAAAAAFPPFINLVLFGQTTVFPLLAFFLGWVALEHGRPYAAGAALSLLAIKPQFGLAVAGVAVLMGHWRLIAGALWGIAMQLGAVVVLLGTDALVTYGNNLLGLSKLEPLLEPKPWQMHSLRSLTNLVPGISDALFVALAASVILVLLGIWRTSATLAAKFAALVIATVLINPHLFVYDATVLAIAFLWLGGWIEREHSSFSRRYWTSIYAAYVLLLIPTARLIYVQMSVLVLCWLLWQIARGARQHQSPGVAIPSGASAQVR
jgi:hypothetical protein